MGKLAKAFGLGKKGKIGLTVAKPVYIAGELVVCTIYADILEPIECDALVLKVTGKEKVEFSHVHTEFRDGESVEQRDHVERDKDFFKQKILCDLVVHERNFKALVASEDSTTQDVKFLCCFSRGTCQLAVAMDKSVYFPGETAQILCNINNGSSVEITAMRCKLYQDITVQLSNGAGSYRTLTKLMCENAFPGRLPSASTKGELIACAYRIDVECDIPWCPDVCLHLPVSIIAAEVPFQAVGWVPESTEGFQQV
ncbi:hypothetical protein PHYSODRAFT_312731 [Phytophthora sojae]|uniref:Arrestin C-terminal-like domain-containing protein n=1 Tax=Phytophthora sojae (strain P6497) TaxID=1094619 RepID=G4Z825_PHYSP|nr:hypothetical protein PHYSODRAFT_312731 [Phytophthora sojae]EGZ19680.1 hypothetical protein PHYSODRAFT_312731 [Phytophthora sojae]|eukprot:XP_009522397.1 hypothetical protein PHYSODRAFT_312731 [Phytophthora sojae]